MPKSNIHKTWGEMVNLHGLISNLDVMNSELQVKIKTNSENIDKLEFEWMNKVQQITSPDPSHHTTDKEHIHQEMCRGSRKLIDARIHRQNLNNAMVTNEKEGHGFLLQYHVYLNSILQSYTDMHEEANLIGTLAHDTESSIQCMKTETVEAARQVRETMQEMNELHYAMKRMVDEHAHNLTTRPDATQKRRGFFKFRHLAEVPKEYDI